VGLGTRVFLWALASSADWARALTDGRVPPFAFLPVALPICVWMIRTFSADARGHGTEAVIAAVHQRSGRVDWLVAPVKLAATVVTDEPVRGHPAPPRRGSASTGHLRYQRWIRSRLRHSGLRSALRHRGAVSRTDRLRRYFPALVAGIVAHLVCGVRPPFPPLQQAFADTSQVKTILIMLACGALFGLIALLLIESLRLFERSLRRFERRPYLLAASGGVALVLLYLSACDVYAGLGTDTINGVLAGTTHVLAGAFLIKILATSITLETGGSGCIVTPIFFVGATSGSALAPIFGVQTTFLAAVGLVAMLAAAANTPIAAAVMAMELLPGPEGVYAALAAATAFLMVGHRSVYASQKIGLSKSAGLDV